MSVNLTIDPGRDPAAEVKRIAIELADDAVQELAAAASESRESGVHEARKRFKELRALLRLVGRAAGRKRTRDARRQARDAGRSLSAARDADVLSETIDRLGERFGQDFERHRELTRTLLQAAQDERPDTDTASRLIAGVRNDIALWSFDYAESDVERAVRKSFRAARRAMRRALDQRTATAFHEWRKREKDHWYHARIAEALIPDMREREPILRRLSRILGDHHDLVLFRDRVVTHAGASNAEAAINLASLALQRMRELEVEAAEVGTDVFSKRELARERVA